MRRRRIIAQLLAQVADVHVHHALAHHHVAAPGLGQQRVAGHHPPGPPHQRHQDVELDARQLHVAAGLRDAPRGHVDGEAGHGDLLIDRVRPRAAQHGPQARQQLPGAEGLGEVVVGAQLEAHHPVGLVAAGRQHDDRHRGARADAAAHLQAVEAGHHHVQQHRVEGALLQRGQALRPVGGVREVHVVLGEVGLEQLREPRVVVDEEHPGGHARLYSTERGVGAPRSPSAAPAPARPWAGRRPGGWPGRRRWASPG